MSFKKPEFKKPEFKKPGKLSLDLKITDRDKKMLIVLAVIAVLAISYYILYQPMSAKLEAVKAERLIMDQRVAQAKSDLANEESIRLEYETELVKGIEASAAFFPKVYPYKDRYLLLLDKLLRGNGVTINSVEFSDPVVSGIMNIPDNRFTLPNYPLGNSAAIINQASQNMKDDGNDLTGTIHQVSAQTETTLSAGAVIRLPISVDFEGSYAQYRAVINGIEKLDRAIALESVKINKKGALVKVQLTMSFYVVDKVDSGDDAFNAWTITGTYGKGDPFN